MHRLDHQIQWLISQNFSDQKFLDFLKQVAQILAEIESFNRNCNEIQTAIQAQEQSQERARKNVKTLGAAGGSRFQQAIEESEDKIQELSKNLEAVNGERAKKYGLLAAILNQEFEATVNLVTS